jgi:hypothetical protein
MRTGYVAAFPPMWQTLIKTAPRGETNVAVVHSAGESTNERQAETVGDI